MTYALLVYANSVAIGGDAVRFRGPIGADLALHLIDGGARLIAGDQAELRRTAKHTHMRVPAAVARLPISLIEFAAFGTPAAARRRLALRAFPDPPLPAILGRW